MNRRKKFDYQRNFPIRPGRLLLGILLAGFAVINLSSGSMNEVEKKVPVKKKVLSKNSAPNILWITTEGVPLSVLSCYGSKIDTTPNIDRIAREGMLFTNSFCTNALCAPSRATLLTGKYDHLNGMYSNYVFASNGQPASTFDPRQENFARIMKDNGYNTAIVGKWHLPANPGEVGFDYYLFKEGAGGPYYQSTGYLQSASFGSTEIENKTYEGYCTDIYTDKAIEWIKDFKSRGKPFILCMQYFNDHRPFDPPHKYEHMYDDRHFKEPATFWDDYETRSSAAKKAHMRIREMPDFDPPDTLTDRQRQEWNYQEFMRHFTGTLKSQDDNIGRLLDFLDESGLSKNTIVVFTGDHGFFMGDHGWFDKRFMYEEALRVPWLIRYPGVIRPGSVSDDWVVNIDNAPTILDLAGIPVPPDMQGKSLVPIFRGSTPSDWRKSMYYHYYEFQAPHWVLPNYGIRTQR